MCDYCRYYDKDCLYKGKCSNKHIINEVYNKAIDDYVCKIQSNKSIADFMKDYLEEIAEQLKR